MHDIMKSNKLSHGLRDKEKKLLTRIIEEYIKSSSPIGSDYLVKKKRLDCCSATVRNGMFNLEKQGYLYQPHISSGRIPTESSYEFYVENIDINQKLSLKMSKRLDQTLKKVNLKNKERKAKFLAKLTAEITKGAVLLAFSKDNYYITGFSNILSQPEFFNMDSMHNLSFVLDNIEDIIYEIFDKIKDTSIFLGSKSIFSPYLASIMSRCSLINHDGMIGILGPMRMDYKQNLGLINYFKSVF